MDLSKAQWELIEPLLPKPKKSANGGGRPPRDAREVLEGILWVLRTGARWSDLPPRYPPSSTCHDRFQKWVETGVFEKILTTLRRDLCERGGVETIEGFIDGTYIPAKKGAHASESRAGGGRQSSWLSRTVMVFHSLSLLLQETDTTVLSPTQRSMLQSWMNSHPD